MNRIVVYLCFMLIASTAFCQHGNKGVPTGYNKKLEKFKARYQSGERDINFIKEYIELLESKYKVNRLGRFAFMRKVHRNPDTKKLILDYVSKCPIRQLSDQAIWELAGEYLMEDVYSNAFEFMHNRIDKFKWGKIDARYSILRKLNYKISSEIKNIAYPSIDSKGTYQMPVYDDEKFLRLQSLVDRGIVVSASEYKIILAVYKEYLSKDYGKMFSILKYGIELNLIAKNEQYISSVVGFIADHSKEKVLLNKCLNTINGFVYRSDKNDGGGFNHYDVISRLYLHMGNSKKGLEAKNKYEAIEAKRSERFSGMMNSLNEKK